MAKGRLAFEWIILLALAIGLALLSNRLDLTSRLDNRLLDFSTGFASKSPSPNIVIVGIDDASLSEIGNWPWPRDVQARLIEQLTAAGARQIVFDILLIEQSDPKNDEVLAAAFKQSGNTIIPHTFGTELNTASGSVPVLPLEQFSVSAAGVGHVGAEADADGVLRRFALSIEDEQTSFPHMIAQASKQIDGPDSAQSASAIADPDRLPIVPFNSLGSYTYYPAADVIEGRVLDEFLRGKIVMVGAVAQGMGDDHQIAAGRIEAMPGIEVQANLYDTLQRGGFIFTARPIWVILFAAFALLLQFLVFWRLSPRLGLIASIAIAVAVGLISVAAVPVLQLWIPPGAALLPLVLAYPLWSWRRLTAVSTYLETQAASLAQSSPDHDTGDGFDMINRQVSRLRNLVGEVSRSFEFLQQVIDAAPDAIIVLDKTGAVQMMNDRGKQLFPQWLPTDGPQFPELLLLAHAKVDRELNELSMSDQRTFLIAEAKLDEGEGGDVGRIVVLRDVTEERRRQNERREMLEFLSHDMRSPQVAIIGLTDRIGGKTKGDISERIRRQAERTMKLADDFVQLARIEEVPLTREDTDIGATIEEACDRAYTQARARKIQIRAELPEEPFFAPVDPMLFARMLDNLISNAVKYSDENGSVKLTLSSPDNQAIHLEVEDDGPGLPEERLKDPFARFGAHETKAGPSAGLGLAFVKRVIDKHEGTITVSSGPNMGTQFSITIP